MRTENMRMVELRRIPLLCILVETLSSLYISLQNIPLARKRTSYHNNRLVLIFMPRQVN